MSPNLELPEPHFSETSFIVTKEPIDQAMVGLPRSPSVLTQSTFLVSNCNVIMSDGYFK